jgi:hypothetical protein
MKHIKLFREGWIDKLFKKDKHSWDFMDDLSKDEILFKRVEDNQVGGSGKGSNLQREDFTDEELNEIKKFKYILMKNILKDYRLKVEWRLVASYDGVNPDYVGYDTIVIKSKPGGFVAPPHQFKILKYQDDWYNVYHTYILESDKRSSANFNTIYYKCDTFEGVIQCLKFCGLE